MKIAKKIAKIDRAKMDKNEINENEHLLSSYCRKIDEYPLLSNAEEKRVALLAANGVRWAKEKLIVSNLRFVVKIARKYEGKGIPLLDLISEGNIGLIRAVESYDANRGFHFVSYAVYWIKQSIIKSLAEKGKLVRMPLSWNNGLYRMTRLLAKNQEKQNVESVDELQRDEMLEEVGLSEKNLIALRELTQAPVSLDQEVGENMGDTTLFLKNIIANENSIDPEQKIMLNSIRQELQLAIKSLKPLESDILKARFALTGERKTLKELGSIYGVTKERIRQIEKQAIEKLKTKMGSKEILEILD